MRVLGIGLVMMGLSAAACGGASEEAAEDESVTGAAKAETRNDGISRLGVLGGTVTVTKAPVFHRDGDAFASDTYLLSGMLEDRPMGCGFRSTLARNGAAPTMAAGRYEVVSSEGSNALLTLVLSNSWEMRCTEALPSGANLGPKDAVSFEPPTAKRMATGYTCLACHGIHKKLIGPSFDQVAEKYQSDPKAAERLVKVLQKGSKDTWGSIPMPPTTMPDRDAKKLVAWVLGPHTGD